MTLAKLLQTIPRNDSAADLPDAKQRSDANLAVLLLALADRSPWCERHRLSLPVPEGSEYILLPEDCHRIIWLRFDQDDIESALAWRPIEWIEAQGARTSGTPQYYALAGLDDTTRQRRLWLLPTPDTDYQVALRYHAAPRAMLDPADAVPCPATHLRAVAHFCALQQDRHYRHDPGQIRAGLAAYLHARDGALHP